MADVKFNLSILWGGGCEVDSVLYIVPNRVYEKYIAVKRDIRYVISTLHKWLCKSVGRNRYFAMSCDELFNDSVDLLFGFSRNSVCIITTLFQQCISL